MCPGVSELYLSGEKWPSAFTLGRQVGSLKIVISLSADKAQSEEVRLWVLQLRNRSIFGIQPALLPNRLQRAGSRHSSIYLDSRESRHAP